MECLKRGVQIIDRTNATALLTEHGRHGARIAGATGVNTRTGEFVVVRAKAVVLATNRPQRVFTFSSEHRGITAFRGASNVGNGHAMAWRIGAEFTMMEKTIRSPFASPYSYPPYGSGNAINTWYPCSIVDANGKEVPWVDVNGNILATVDERCRPAKGQKFFIMGGGNASQPHPGLKQYGGPRLCPDLDERMVRGEFTPPFYADLTSMPEYERRVIWGLMVGQEGRTRVPVWQTYGEGGAQMIVAASQQRKASSSTLHFSRLDYPQMDPPDWQKFVVIRRGEKAIETTYRPQGFWGDLETNFAPRNAENRAALEDRRVSAA